MIESCYEMIFCYLGFLYLACSLNVMKSGWGIGFRKASPQRVETLSRWGVLPPNPKKLS